MDPNVITRIKLCLTAGVSLSSSDRDIVTSSPNEVAWRLGNSTLCKALSVQCGVEPSRYTLTIENLEDAATQISIRNVKFVEKYEQLVILTREIFCENVDAGFAEKLHDVVLTAKEHIKGKQFTTSDVIPIIKTALIETVKKGDTYLYSVSDEKLEFVSTSRLDFKELEEKYGLKTRLELIPW
jgi:hypothetical protein